VLQCVVARLEFVEVDGDMLRTSKRFSPANELNGSELALFEFIRTHGPVVPFQELYEANRAAGYQTITLAVRLKQSPVIRKAGHGLYALVGAALTASAIADALSRVSSVSADPKIRFNIDGTVEFAVNAGSWLVYGGVMPTSLLQPLTGDWSAESGDKVTVGDKLVFGLDSVVGDLNVSFGDRVNFIFNTWTRRVTAQKGSQA
jgi:hypothetical protein